MLLQKVQFLSSKTTHFIQKKISVNRRSLSHKFIMIDSWAVNKTLENVSASTRSFPSKSEGIALCSAFMLFSVSITAGNLLTLVLFAATKPLRRKSSFLVLNMHMTFADLMLGAFTLPFYIYLVGDDYQLWTAKYDFEHMAYKIFDASFDNIFLLGSYISAASISCERFYAVFWPFKHRSLSTRTYRITIFSIWTFAVLLSTLITFLYVSSSFESSLYVFIPVVLGLTVIICVCNIAIWRNFQRERVATQHRNGASRNRRLTKTLLLMSTLALVCWLPLIILNILINMTKTSIPRKFYLMVNILNYSNSFVNPIVYVFRIPEFQQALRSCDTKRRPAIKMVKTERRNRKVAPITPETQLRILRNDPSHLQVEVEQEGIRKLSFSQLR